MSIGLKYKNNEKIFREVTGETPYLSYPMFEETDAVIQGFSTRLGGVSKGDWTSLNLSYSRGDQEKDVLENFRRIGKALGVSCEDMVYSQQTHTTNVRKVTAEDRGKGVVRPRGYQDVDGLITNEPGICLVTSFADCVPLYFVDPVHKAIGLTHSGWRGTVGKIGKNTVRKMGEEYGSRPEDILAAIGPSICRECYEVSEDVILQFQEAFPQEQWSQIYDTKDNGKYQLDLWKANELIFLESGIKEEHIRVTNVCTRCNSELLFSHRAAGEKRGNLCAFLALK